MPYAAVKYIANSQYILVGFLGNLLNRVQHMVSSAMRVNNSVRQAFHNLYKTFRQVISLKFLRPVELNDLGINIVCPIGNQAGILEPLDNMKLKCEAKTLCKADNFLMKYPYTPSGPGAAQ